MNNAIAYRGPDEKATIHFENCSFGFSRIRIKGNYHSSNEFCFLNKTIRVIFNGEIYNYQLLKNLLIKSGVAFQTDLELELIAALFAYYGENFV
jgi:Asparagine synthase (glutamine-hydrolyzing)